MDYFKNLLLSKIRVVVHTRHLYFINVIFFISTLPFAINL